MRWSRAVLATAVLSTTALACELILGIEEDHFRLAAGAGDGAPGISDPCAHAQPPPPPDGGDGPGPDLLPLLFAVETFDVSGRNKAGQSVGFDLDGVCTCDTRPGAAHGGAPSCHPFAPGDAGTNACDADGGIDDSLASDLLSSFSGLITNALASSSQCGRQTILLQVSRYNGQADDGLVEVAIAPTFGIFDPHPGGEDFDAAADCFPPGTTFPNGQVPDGGAYPAKRDGTDRWSIAPSYLDAPGLLNSRYVGYVSNHQLVVSLAPKDNPASSWSIVFSSQIVPLSTAILSAHLAPQDAGFRIDEALLTSRVKVDDLLSSVGSLHNETGANFVCAAPYYANIKQIACASADLTTLQSRDFSGDSCDALSLVAQFSAGPAALGQTPIVLPSPPTGCGAGFRDTCPR